MKRDDERPFDERETVASATECTGLMPALPEDEAADESVAALYAIHSGKGTRSRQYRKA